MTSLTLSTPAQKIIKTLQDNGFSAFVVGGAVRDLLLQKEVVNWDFTTDATPEELLKIFPDAYYNNQFGTVGITLENLEKHFSLTATEKKEIYEITTFRSEKGYTDRRHPDQVSWGKTIEEDLKRRDFTINTMALTIDKKTKKSKLIDLYHGQEDLKNKIVKTVGNPEERFQEDALRMMRAVRFSSTLGFLIEEETFSAIKKNYLLLKNISWERIRDELLKILASPFPYEGVLNLKKTGILSLVLPEVEKCFGVEQKSLKRHHIYDVGTHLLLSLKECPNPDPIVRFATLLHDIGKAATIKKLPSGVITFYNHEIVGARMIKGIIYRLRLSREQREKLWTLVRWHQFSVDEHQTDSAIRRFIRRVGVENIKDMIDLRIADRLGGGVQTATSWRLRLYMKKIIDVQTHTPSVKDLKVNGNDVMQTLQIKPGPKVGKILDKLFKEITEDPSINERELLLKKIIDLNK